MRHFTIEVIWMAKKPTKPQSIAQLSLVTREMQMKITVRYHCTVTKMPKTKQNIKANNTKIWRGCGATGMLTYCYWGFKMVQSL